MVMVVSQCLTCGIFAIVTEAMSREFQVGLPLELLYVHCA